MASLIAKAVELIPGGYPATPEQEKNEGNKESPATPEQEKNEGNKESPLEFQPNPSSKPAGSSALGWVAANTTQDEEDLETPDHPLYEQNPLEESVKGEIDTSHTINPHNIAASNQKGGQELGNTEPNTSLNQKSSQPSDFVLPNVILPESRLLPANQKLDSHQTFDLTGDYNKQKEDEQRAESKVEQDKHDHKPSGKHEPIDMSVKPLGDQQPPLPYKPESDETNSKDKYVAPHLPPVKVPAGNTDRSVDDHQQTDGKGEAIPPNKPTAAVHPEGDPKLTTKDKVNATLDKAVGTLKEKIGKLVKNDNLAAKGTVKKNEANKTKELAEAQKKVDDI